MTKQSPGSQPHESDASPARIGPFDLSFVFDAEDNSWGYVITRDGEEVFDCSGAETIEEAREEGERMIADLIEEEAQEAQEAEED